MEIGRIVYDTFIKHLNQKYSEGLDDDINKKIADIKSVIYELPEQIEPQIGIKRYENALNLLFEILVKDRSVDYKKPKIKHNEKNAIVNHILENRDSLIPVIGYEMVEYVTEAGVHIPFQQFIVTAISKSIHFSISQYDLQTYGSLDNLKDVMISNGYYGLTLLRKHFLGTDHQYKTEYDDIIKSNISRIHLKENVKELLLLFNPKIIITTLPINVIELDLGYDLTSSIYYYKDGVQSTIQEELYSSTVLDFIGNKKNLVYHIFGPAKGAIQTGGWVKNEMDLLEYLHTLHTRTPDGLVKYIQATKAHLLVLGCCLPDWFFRFLLYPMNPSGGCLINPHDYGESLNYYLSA